MGHLYVKNEVAAVRGGRRSLTFGISDQDVDEALQDLETIEVSYDKQFI